MTEDEVRAEVERLCAAVIALEREVRRLTVSSPKASDSAESKNAVVQSRGVVR
jgi:hypothetical protein